MKMNKTHAAFLLPLAIGVVAAISAMAQTSPHGIDVEELLDSLPKSLETHGSIHEGYQAIGHIPRNLETVYGVACFLESPFDRENYTGPFPSKEKDYVPLVVDEMTDVREFLETTCSDGKLAWGVVRNAIHIWPAKGVMEKATHLDTTLMSLDLSGVSMLDAVKAWALALNTNREPAGHGVALTHTFAHTDMTRSPRATPPSMIAQGTVTVKVEEVTAREALCAILGASEQLVWISYNHLPNSNDVVSLHATKAEIDSCPEITIEEHKALKAHINLDSVLVEPAMSGEQR
jgi:hypothetical protein